MYSFLFQNRWFAAAWVAFLLISVAAFFSEGGGQEQLDKAAALIREGNRAQALPPLVAVPETIEEDAEEEEAVSDRVPAEATKARQPEPAEDENADVYVVIDKSAPIQAASDEELAPAM